MSYGGGCGPEKWPKNVTYYLNSPLRLLLLTKTYIQVSIINFNHIVQPFWILDKIFFYPKRHAVSSFSNIVNKNVYMYLPTWKCMHLTYVLLSWANTGCQFITSQHFWVNQLCQRSYGKLSMEKNLLNPYFLN